MPYSQHGEEAAILAAFPGKTDGRFLDIGAWHPTDKSNTRALYERGWSGVMIEPSPGPFINLMRACQDCGDVPSELYGERKSMTCEKCGGGRYGEDERLTLICAAVGLERGLMRLHATDDAVSTSKEYNFKEWEEVGGFFGQFLSPVLLLEDIFNQFGGMDFINLDVEGASADLFVRMFKIGVFPTCVCVEHDKRVEELCGLALEQNYCLKYCDGTNLVFAHPPA